jgi:hypothetical protein
MNDGSEFNFDIDAYGLDDLLGMFRLSRGFGEDDLRRARKVVMQTHPDKSGLSKDYFLFFTKAYKIVHSLHEFRARSCSAGTVSTEYTAECDEERRLLVGELMERSDFNAVFNELFEKNELSSRHASHGHGDWLKSDDDIDRRQATKATMHDVFAEKKRELGVIMPAQTVEGLESCDGLTDLVDDDATFSSGVFSSLPYDDVRRAHTQTVVPSWQEPAGAARCRSVDELRRQRAADGEQPPSLEQAQRMLRERQEAQCESDVHRAFRLAKEDEAARVRTEAWLGSFKRLKDS